MSKDLNEFEVKLIDSLLQEAANKYSESKATTNCGRWLRFLASIIPTDIIVKIFADRLSK